MRARCSVTIHAPVARVYDTLLDPYAFPRWVMGARKIREVDDDWPSPMSSFHHEVGLWPVRIKDKTTIISCEPNRLVRLRARAWPAGEADVTLSLAERDGATTITMEEEPAAGPMRALWSPALIPPLHARNQLSLQRLKRLLER